MYVSQRAEAGAGKGPNMRTLLVLLALAPLSAFAADAASDYNPQGRRDPFQPPIRATPVVSKIALERFEISELTLEGVVSGISDPRATVIVPGGESFLVGVGTIVGKWGGRVVRITHTDVVVREEFHDFTGIVHVVETPLSLAEPLPL